MKRFVSKSYITQAKFCFKRLATVLECLFADEQPLIKTGVLSQSPAQFASLWALREGVPEALGKEGKVYKYDISVPLSSFKDVVDGTREHLRSKGLLGEHAVKHVVGYGHCGDGAITLLSIPNIYLTRSHQAIYT